MSLPLLSRFNAAKAQAKSRADARVHGVAEKKLTKAIAKELENALPTSKSGSEWWIDPVIGLRGQINITRWLFLAIQGDVGGFGAGSQIAWQASGSVGVNLTRNIFLETGYRYFYMDYDNGGFLVFSVGARRKPRWGQLFLEVGPPGLVWRRLVFRRCFAHDARLR